MLSNILTSPHTQQLKLNIRNILRKYKKIELQTLAPQTINNLKKNKNPLPKPNSIPKLPLEKTPTKKITNSGSQTDRLNPIIIQKNPNRFLLSKRKGETLITSSKIYKDKKNISRNYNPKAFLLNKQIPEKNSKIPKKHIITNSYSLPKIDTTNSSIQPNIPKNSFLQKSPPSKQHTTSKGSIAKIQILQKLYSPKKFSKRNLSQGKFSSPFFKNCNTDISKSSHDSIEDEYDVWDNTELALKGVDLNNSDPNFLNILKMRLQNYPRQKEALNNKDIVDFARNLLGFEKINKKILENFKDIERYDVPSTFKKDINCLKFLNLYYRIKLKDQKTKIHQLFPLEEKKNKNYIKPTVGKFIRSKIEKKENFITNTRSKGMEVKTNKEIGIFERIFGYMNK